MSQLLPRFRTTPQPRRLADQLAQIETRDNTTHDTLTAGTTNNTPMNILLRGIPCTARGVNGTSPGTDPLRELLLKSDRHTRYTHRIR